MYLFTRTGRLRPGNIRESMAWALGVTEKVNQITSLDVGLWTTMLSPGNGTLAWSTFVEDLTALDTANAKLSVDDMFMSEVERGVQYMTQDGVDDAVAQLVHGEIDPSRRPSCATVVRSELAPGGFGKGIEAGVEIAKRSTAICGLPTTFLVATTGKYGGVAWITAAESLEELEVAGQTLNADPGFVQYIDEVATGAYLPGVTTQVMYNRIV